MKTIYFNALPQAEKPFVTWISVGSFTPEEFTASGYEGDPLIVSEDRVAGYAYGVCLQKIVSGNLVNRTPSEMAIFEAEYNIIMGVKSEAQRITSINNDKFTFDGNDFPMDEVSRLFYMCIEKTTPSSSKIRTMANTAYNLSDTNIAAFMTAYYSQLLLISKHTI